MALTNRIVGILVALSCIPLWTIATEFPDLASAFPKTVLAIVAGLAVLLVVRSFIPALADKARGEGSAQPRALIRPLLVAALACAAAVAMPIVGFFPAMAALGAIVFFVLGVEERMTYAAVVIGGLVFIYAVFVNVLGVPLEASRILGQ